MKYSKKNFVILFICCYLEMFKANSFKLEDAKQDSNIFQDQKVRIKREMEIEDLTEEEIKFLQHQSQAWATL